MFLIHEFIARTPTLENYAEKTASFIGSVSGAVFIFVLGAVFILLQENYHKFNSTVFFKYIIKRSMLSVALSIVLILIGFSVNIFQISKAVYCIICISTLIIGAFSCLRLLHILNKVLDYQFLLDSVLLPRIKQEEISSYIEGEVDKKESSIDVSLKIILSAIHNDPIATGRLFCSFFEWFYENWNRFKLDDIKSQQNKFTGYLPTVIDEVLGSNNFTVQANFINSLSVIIDKIEFSKIKQFSYFYRCMKAFLLRGLDKNVDDTILLSLIRTILWNYPQYLNGVKSKDDYDVLKKAIWNPIEAGVMKAVSIKDYKFLRNLSIIDVLFRDLDEQDNPSWNNFYNQALIDYLSLLSSIGSKTDDNDSFMMLFRELESCDWLVMSESSTAFEPSINVVTNMYRMIFYDYIDSNYDDIRFFSFTELFESIMRDSFKFIAREKSVDRLFMIVDYYLSKVDSKENSVSKYESLRVLVKIDNSVRKLEQGNEDSISIAQKMKSYRKELVDKYEKTFSGYEDYLKSGDVILSLL